MSRLCLLLALVLVLAACSGDKPPVAEAPPAKPAAPTATVIDPQLQALERAKAVQQQVDAQKAATDAKLREAEGQ